MQSSQSAGSLEALKYVKDWDLAANARQRQARYFTREATRSQAPSPSAAWGLGQTKLMKLPSLVRGPKRNGFGDTDWHEKRAEKAFKRLDIEKRGEVPVHKLVESFADLGAAMGSETFLRYSLDLGLATTEKSFFAPEDPLKAAPPTKSEYVSEDQFVCFHNTVWKNQSVSLRVLAGDPSVGGSGVGCEQKALGGLQMKSSSSAPQLLRDQGPIHREHNEAQAFAAFERYSAGSSIGVSCKDVPLVLDDMGLSLGGYCGLEECELESFLRTWFESNGINEQGYVRFPAFVGIVNDYIIEAGRLRAARTQTTSTKAKSSMFAALQFGKKQKKKKAVFHSLPSCVGNWLEITPRSKARDILEDLLLEGDYVEDQLRQVEKEREEKSAAEAAAAAAAAVPKAEDDYSGFPVDNTKRECRFQTVTAANQVGVKNFQGYAKSKAKSLARGCAEAEKVLTVFFEKVAEKAPIALPVTVTGGVMFELKLPPFDGAGKRTALHFIITKQQTKGKEGLKIQIEEVSSRIFV